MGSHDFTDSQTGRGGLESPSPRSATTAAAAVTTAAAVVIVTAAAAAAAVTVVTLSRLMYVTFINVHQTETPLLSEIDKNSFDSRSRTHNWYGSQVRTDEHFRNGKSQEPHAVLESLNPYETAFVINQVYPISAAYIRIYSSHSRMPMDSGKVDAKCMEKSGRFYD
ncbi:hypothetical protein HZH68_006039 [Vespula germanica]|uniref:Uncharacterized protein n=1 Tax=Vespula germanica TaxID=30212 RepID=A0A834NAW6_VESGE|nr:hypothetical protein HZH68_006039 [Vespula germanica]